MPMNARRTMPFNRHLVQQIKNALPTFTPPLTLLVRARRGGGENRFHRSVRNYQTGDDCQQSVFGKRNSVTVWRTILSIDSPFYTNLDRSTNLSATMARLADLGSENLEPVHWTFGRVSPTRASLRLIHTSTSRFSHASRRAVLNREYRRQYGLASGHFHPRSHRRPFMDHYCLWARGSDDGRGDG